MVAADYMLKVAVSNFKNAWESMGEDGERVDEYGLGPRGSLAEAVRAVVDLLGMQPCEVCADGFISCMNISTLMKIFWITEQYNYVSTLKENKSSRK